MLPRGAGYHSGLISKYDHVKKLLGLKKCTPTKLRAAFEGNSCTCLNMIDLTHPTCLLGCKSEVFDVQNVPVQQFPSKPLDICCA